MKKVRTNEMFTELHYIQIFSGAPGASSEIIQKILC